MGSHTDRHTLWVGDARDAYPAWTSPDLIISDGAYGIGGFPGDPSSTAHLPDWYEPHVDAWTQAAHHWTSLWVWNTEVGWATIHPLIESYGWEYAQTVVWDKGLAHVAGNVNGDTIRQFPVVTEISVLYRRALTLTNVDGDETTAQSWLRSEWLRSGLPLTEANKACGVKVAATRKYLAHDQWYFPPDHAVEAMSAYLNVHGAPDGRPYMPDEDNEPMTAVMWGRYRAVWNHTHGITNVWHRHPVNGTERFRGTPGRTKKATHLNQKPLEFMERQIRACTDRGDVVWEPFGGLATASVAAIRLGRYPYVAELNLEHARLAEERLATVQPHLPGL